VEDGLEDDLHAEVRRAAVREGLGRLDAQPERQDDLAPGEDPRAQLVDVRLGEAHLVAGPDHRPAGDPDHRRARELAAGDGHLHESDLHRGDGADPVRPEAIEVAAGLLLGDDDEVAADLQRALLELCRRELLDVTHLADAVRRAQTHVEATAGDHDEEKQDHSGGHAALTSKRRANGVPATLIRSSEAPRG
jgi:hypothetical protein